MNEQRKKEAPLKKRLNDEDFERLIRETITNPISIGFVSKCYCRRCRTSWDMRKGGVEILRKENPEARLKEPAEINDLNNEEELKKCYFIVEPCFVCRRRGEKIQTEVYLLPNQQTKEVVWQRSLTLTNNTIKS